MRRDPWKDSVREWHARRRRARGEHVLVAFVPPRRFTRLGRARIDLLRVLLRRQCSLAIATLERWKP